METDAKQVMKEAFREALKEFLQERWNSFSGSFTKWVLSLAAAAIVAGVTYFILLANGWRHP